MEFWKKYLKNKNEMYMIFSDSRCEAKSKIVSFDLDGTLVTTKTGKTFATSSEDWKWLNEKVIPTLQQEVERDAKIVIFTNQKGIMSRGEINTKKCDEFCQRIEHIIKQLAMYEIYVQVFVAISDNIYRKPLPGMWSLLEKNNQCIKIDKSKSYFIGDAAGRGDNWMKGKKKDFSCSDRKFAKNVGIKFNTPEEYFLGMKPCEFEWDDIDMNSFPLVSGRERLDLLKIQFKEGREMILFVGSPASGKTSFYEKYLKPKGYGWINMDTLGNKTKCMREAKKLIENESLVIDNSNPTIEGRQEFIELAKKNDIPIRCFYFECDKKLTNHLNTFRALTTNKNIPAIAINVYYKKFVQPRKEEGFTEIITIPFVVEEDYLLTNDTKQLLYYSY
ncbi:hypothetical protein ENUP19_0248G0105 [Entamoeba nuttalli]|uniref:DNA 3'-phosphatase domain containing protein n=2 Tax=Entamoeba nuttalli TaxID=412467 RepID=K2HP00_ENTNP|nr:DNA 3'-phosphatase domain containing protein [Entamoeba nuttalli P19]EKE37575.1 DNA 3'-phosphatase domain containing protein [Entamoeba nuttalli P19]|eukprot:XP_008860101.1 DNA 3'-phosphatase domain containing protein [Entamoeba nuttalli P19]